MVTCATGLPTEVESTCTSVEASSTTGNLQGPSRDVFIVVRETDPSGGPCSSEVDGGTIKSPIAVHELGNDDRYGHVLATPEVISHRGFMGLPQLPGSVPESVPPDGLCLSYCCVAAQSVVELLQCVRSPRGFFVTDMDSGPSQAYRAFQTCATALRARVAAYMLEVGLREESKDLQSGCQPGDECLPFFARELGGSIIVHHSLGDPSVPLIFGAGPIAAELQHSVTCSVRGANSESEGGHFELLQSYMPQKYAQSPLWLPAQRPPFPSTGATLIASSSSPSSSSDSGSESSPKASQVPFAPHAAVTSAYAASPRSSASSSSSTSTSSAPSVASDDESECTPTRRHVVSKKATQAKQVSKVEAAKKNTAPMSTTSSDELTIRDRLKSYQPPNAVDRRVNGYSHRSDARPAKLRVVLACPGHGGVPCVFHITDVGKPASVMPGFNTCTFCGVDALHHMGSQRRGQDVTRRLLALRHDEQQAALANVAIFLGDKTREDYEFRIARSRSRQSPKLDAGSDKLTRKRKREDTL